MMVTRSESRKKFQNIGVRVTPDEKVKLKARANAFGISMGALCRETIFGVTPKSKTDLDAIQQLSATRADMGRLGGLLKGWLSGSFSQGPPSPQTQAEVVVLLREIGESQRLVVNIVKNLTNKS